MFIDNLILEVTRKCNMKCRHCLRGSAQDLSMSKQTIQNALKGVSRITTLQFTGGEPILGLYQIRTILETIRENQIDVGWFWLKSNGIKYSAALINHLADFQEYVDEPDMSAMEFSLDQFHLKTNLSLNKYLVQQEVNPWIQAPKSQNLRYLIKEGRAKRFLDRVSYRDPFFYSGWPIAEDYLKDQYSTIAYDFPVYIAANGNIICGCDLSFKHIDKYSFGNVNKQSLQSIIEAHIVDNPEKIFPK